MLSDAQIKQLKASISLENKSQNSDSELFAMFVSVYKGSKLEPKAIQKEINSKIDSLTKSDVIAKAKKQVNSLAKDYIELNIITKFD